MTPVVIDASAGVELIAETPRGRRLRRLLPADAAPWVPDLFYGECAGVLRRWDLNAILPPSRVTRALNELNTWPLHVVQTKGLLADAWTMRHNLTIPDGVYVAVAKHLNAPILTDDIRLTNAPAVTVPTLHL